MVSFRCWAGCRLRAVATRDNDVMRFEGEDVEAATATTRDVRSTVANNMRRSRLSKGLSLRELAERTGLSPALLSQVERGTANPTLDALGKIAAALSLSFVDLTWQFSTDPIIIRAGEGPVTQLGSTTVRTLFGSTDRRRFEVSVGSIGKNTTSPRENHGNGSVEYAFLIAGTVTVTTSEWSIVLNRGDALRFSAEVEHSYVTGDEGCEVLTLVSPADDWITSEAESPLPGS